MKHKAYGPYERYFKRPLDFVFALVFLILLCPVIIITAILVRIKLGSPVFFSQERPGKDEKIFRLYKFRSMTDAKDSSGRLLSDDERLTGFGRRLRATSLDELPELFNILKGQMSLIGPRPLLVRYIPYYKPEERCRHDVRPGLTGLAQVNGRNAITWDEKFRWDIKYVNRITFLGDVRILLKTIEKTLKHSDILVGTQHTEGPLDVARAGREKAYVDSVK